MSARTVRIIDCTFDPVSGLVTIDFKLKPEAESHRPLYQAVARGFNSGDPIIELEKNLGEYPKVNPEDPTVLNGDIEISLKIPLGSLEAEEKAKQSEAKPPAEIKSKEIKLGDLKSKDIKLK